MADSTNNASARAWAWEIYLILRPVFGEVILISFFVNALALAVPIFTMQVYDRVVFHHGIATLYGLVIGMIAVVVFDYILRVSRARIMQTVALRVDVLVGRKLFDKLMALPLQALESQPGSYWTALFRDVDVVRNTVSGAAAVLMADLPFTILFVGLIMVIASQIAWVFLVIIPLFAFVAWRSAAVMNEANQEERETSMSRDALIGAIVDGRTTIKALALDRAMRPIWEDRHANNIEKAIVRGSKTDAYSNLGQTLSVVTPVFLTTVGAIAILEQTLTMGGLIATNMLSGRIIGPMNQLVGQWRGYSSFKQSIERLGMLFNAESERLESEVQLDRPKGEITLENVSFSYSAEGRPVIDRVNLTIPAGGVISIVGRNGSGKTTLLKLILGLYKPSDGRVVLDGADLNQFTRMELADWIGYVPQDCVLFEGSIKDNICHRHPDAADDAIVGAATGAGVHHFIIDMPDGYATEIGEAGRRLSGGQRQRIAVARALLGDPPVLLFDEPSSSLDRHAEQELRNTIVELGKTRTVILVTHSPTLLAASNTLIALDRGKVALHGPAQDILPKLFGPAGKRPPANNDAEAQKTAETEKSGPPNQPPPGNTKAPIDAPSPGPKEAAPIPTAAASSETSEKQATIDSGPTARAEVPPPPAPAIIVAEPAQAPSPAPAPQPAGRRPNSPKRQAEQRPRVEPPQKPGMRVAAPQPQPQPTRSAHPQPNAPVHKPAGGTAKQRAVPKRVMHREKPQPVSQNANRVEPISRPRPQPVAANRPQQQPRLNPAKRPAPTKPGLRQPANQNQPRPRIQPRLISQEPVNNRPKSAAPQKPQKNGAATGNSNPRVKTRIVPKPAGQAAPSAEKHANRENSMRPAALNSRPLDPKSAIRRALRRPPAGGARPRSSAPDTDS